MASERKLVANRRNARRSTGPQTPAGKAAVRYNALKHGLLAREVVVTGGNQPEDPREFEALHAALIDDCQPVGFREEQLVGTMAVCYWRQRRARRFETAEIRRRYGVPVVADEHDLASRPSVFDSVPGLRALPGGGSSLLEHTSAGIDQLLELVGGLHFAVQVQGHLTERDRDRLLDAFGKEEGSVGYLCFAHSYWITDRDQIAKEHPELLDDAPTPEECQQRLLNELEDEHTRLTSLREQVARREALQRDLDQACLALPPAQAGDRLLRYETAIDRQLYKAMNELERLQRRRRGDAVPPPLNVEVSHN